MEQTNDQKKGIFNFIKKHANYIFLAIVIGFTAYIFATRVDPKTIFNVIRQAEFGYLIVAVLCVFGFWILEAYILLKLLRRDNPDEKMSFAWILTMVGQYYNLIDPGSTSGQPFQLFELSRRKYSIGTGTAVLLQKYALYQFTITFIAVVAAVITSSTLPMDFGADKWLLVFGLVLNIFVVILIVILIVNPNTAKRIITAVINFLLKLHILKDSEKYYQKIDFFMEEYQIAIVALESHKKQTAKMFLISFIQIFMLFSVNYWVYRSLGLHGTNAFTIISLQALLYVTVAFLPTPGASGGAEAAFLLIFTPIYGGENVAIGMILWRTITFYFILLFAGSHVAVHSFKMGKAQQIEDGKE